MPELFENFHVNFTSVVYEAVHSFSVEEVGVAVSQIAIYMLRRTPPRPVVERTEALVVATGIRSVVRLVRSVPQADDIPHVGVDEESEVDPLQLRPRILRLKPLVVLLEHHHATVSSHQRVADRALVTRRRFYEVSLISNL